MKQEVRRGRKFVEYHDPDTQDKRTFTQEISVADVSYQDEQGRWQQRRVQQGVGSPLLYSNDCETGIPIPENCKVKYRNKPKI